MRSIRKQREPTFWREFRKTSGAFYGIDWMPKQDLREALAKEQGYLCCYCMGRIEATQEGMKVEHWSPQNPQDGHSDEQIDYGNLLGACTGNQGHPFTEQHCDTHKGNTPISVNPAIQRKAILDGLRSWLEKEYQGRSVGRDVLLQKAQEWERAGPDGKLNPFCQVAIFWLNKAARGR